MSMYSYQARNNSGESVTGTVEALTEQEVIFHLRQMQCTPVKISQTTTAKTSQALKLNFNLDFLVKKHTKIKVRDTMMFCTNLSSMISAGVPLLGALNVISEQLTNPELAKTVRLISKKVGDGAPLSEALVDFPKVFSNFFVNMVRVAEMSGTMDHVLKELSIYMEKQELLRQTIRGMFVYPIVLMTAGTLVIVLIITFVMPQFVTIFQKANVPLPTPTKILYETGLWIKQFWYLLLIGIGAMVYGIKMYFKTQKGRDFFDHAVLKIPILGSLVNKSLVARFSRTLGAMLNTGVPLLQSLRIVEKVLGNKVYGDMVYKVYESVEKGEGIHPPLMEYKFFPKDVAYMISVGEKTGNIGAMLNKVADFYEEKVQFEIKDLVVMIEPTFVGIMGVCVGGLLASIILPMFDMIKTIQR